MELTNLGHATLDELDITPTPQVLQLLENLTVEPWRCVAELIDNSLDDFRRTKNAKGIVKVFCDGHKLFIQDNGSGMSPEELRNALRAGYSSKSKTGELGLFGVGFNVACARLGRRATVVTRRAHDPYWTSVLVDINELIKKDSFLIQPSLVSISAEETSGTIVIIDLHKEHRANFSRPKYLQSIADDLGKAYSYILRGEVPGLSGEAEGNPRSVEIYIDDNLVKPWLPCIWDEARTVTYKGSNISAVQKFERQLPDGAVCEDCGYWQHDSSLTNCAACKGSDLTIASRRVWGWIGVQRYMDRLGFGINFIRNGRTILFQDQTIFTFKDDTTGESYKDYPVEWPADMGRIVGEVHCDHVRVDFIKREFDASDRSWSGVVEVVRGSSSLQPKRARGAEPNNSPLALIFNAFRINEPGVRYLIPGNGKKAIHDASRNWGGRFHAGEPDYWTDAKWFKAAQNHDRGGAEAPVPPPTPGTQPGTKIDPFDLGGGPAPTGAPRPAPETTNEKMKRWEKGGVERVDLDKVVTPASIGKSYNLTAWETFSEIVGDDGKPVPVVAIPVSGTTIRAYAYMKADAFVKYGRDTTDLILMESAQQIKTLSASNKPLSVIFGDVLAHFPDEERSEAVVRRKIAEIEIRLQRKLAPLTVSAPSKFWETLSPEERDQAEEAAVASGRHVIWKEAISTGEFADFIPLRGVRDVVLKAPELVFDGKLFKQHYATAHAESARKRAQGYAGRALSDLAELKTLNSKLSAYELNTANSALAFIDDSLSD